MLEASSTYQVGTLRYTRSALAMLFFWLLWGDFCFMLMENVIPSILPLKLEHLGASNVAVGLILATIPSAISSICNPVISYRSDRFRSRFGRRIPFIAVGTPLIVLSILGVAYGERIGFFLHRHAGALLQNVSPVTTSLVIIGVMMGAFGLFNMLGTSAFWYLFNDVVPPTLLARFMSWFRMVSLASVSLYNLFIFKYAGSHSTAIMVSIACLYLVGFFLMCVNVREGEYPPPPPYADGQSGIIAAIKTYSTECHSLPHYWFVFLIAMGYGSLSAANTFALFFSQSIGLSLAQIGILAGVANIVTSLLILASGWLADRFHPTRIVIAGLVFQVCVTTPASLVWLVWHPSANVTFYFSLAMTVFLAAPAGALIGVLDPPLFMRVFPRENYGQFCSANSIWRSWSVIANGALIGLYLDTLTKHFGSAVAYRCLPFWMEGSYLFMLYFAIQLFHSWKQYGGDDAYVAPVRTRIIDPITSATTAALLPGSSELVALGNAPAEEHQLIEG